MIKAFHRYIKVFLALEVIKSVLEELVFVKSKFLNLAKFDFLDLIKFVIIDRFFIFIPISPLPILLITLLVVLRAL